MPRLGVVLSLNDVEEHWSVKRHDLESKIPNFWVTSCWNLGSPAAKLKLKYICTLKPKFQASPPAAWNLDFQIVKLNISLT